MKDYRKIGRITWSKGTDDVGRPWFNALTKVVCWFKNGEWGRALEISTESGYGTAVGGIDSLSYNKEQYDSICPFYEDACELAKTNLDIRKVYYLYDWNRCKWNRYTWNETEGMKRA